MKKNTKNVRAPKKKSIKTVIAFSVAGILALSILAVLITARLFLKSYFSNQIKDDIELLSSQAATIIEKEIEQTESVIVELSRSPLLYDKKFTEKEKVDFYMQRAEELNYILFFYIEPDGMCTNLTPEGDQLDLSEMEYFKRSMNGEVFTTNIITDALTGDKIVIISAPYYENGEIKGVFAGIKSADFFNDMCKSFIWEESSALSILDKEANVIGHTNQDLVKEQTI